MAKYFWRPQLFKSKCCFGESDNSKIWLLQRRTKSPSNNCLDANKPPWTQRTPQAHLVTRLHLLRDLYGFVDQRPEFDHFLLWVFCCRRHLLACPCIHSYPSLTHVRTVHTMCVGAFGKEEWLSFLRMRVLVSYRFMMGCMSGLK